MERVDGVCACQVVVIVVGVVIVGGSSGGGIVLTVVGTPTDWTDNTMSREVCGERSKIGCGRSAGGL